MRNHVLGGLAAVTILAGSVFPAQANDSTASLDTGDLVLVPNADIRMASEDLFISREEIRVRYVFVNEGAATITTPVAFPLPPVSYAEEANYAVDSDDPLNFVGFRLWIDGRPVKFRIDARATAPNGRDVTGLLARHDVPLTTFAATPEGYDRLRARLDALSPQAMAELRAAGAIHPADWGEGFFEAWTAHVTFYWTQDFPPGQAVTVEHAYRPVPTHTFFSAYDLEARTWHEEACIDQAFANAARKRLAAQEYQTLGATILHYILTTANNWRGPIGRFHLTVDKGSTDAIVSLCRDGIRKTAPTVFEWQATDYRPDRDLTLLFLEPFQ